MLQTPLFFLKTIQVKNDFLENSSICLCLFLWLTYFLKGDEQSEKNMDGANGVIYECCITEEVITLQPKC